MTWLRAFAVIAFAVVLFVLGTLGSWMFVQDLQIRPQADGSVVIDVQFLGEYCANVARIRINEVSNGKTVFEVRASGEFVPIWTFGLKAGKNRLELDDTPANASATFDLNERTEYQVTVWAIKSGLHVRRSRRFTLPAIPHRIPTASSRLDRAVSKRPTGPRWRAQPDQRFQPTAVASIHPRR
jgi:hypothetical protein